MLRNIILLGTAAGVAVAFPMIYESRQDAIHGALMPKPVETHQEGFAPVQLSLAQEGGPPRDKVTPLQGAWCGCKGIVRGILSASSASTAAAWMR